MAKLLSYPISIVYFIFFGITLVVFHPLQWIALNVFGYQAHKVVVDALQFMLMRCQNILGTRFSCNHEHKVPKGQPVIIVSNHQSMFDIPPIIWFLRRHHPKFISKKELGKGIPSVSYNLRHGGSVLIDRKDPKQAIAAIQKFADYIETNKRAAVIFPEGTRSRDGRPRPFQVKGLLTLFEGIPSAIILPITINDSWKTIRYGKFPLGLGAHLKMKVHAPIVLKDHPDHQALIKIIETQIKDAIKV
ncbi:lysophospholipid acyltransferase family protein [Aureisphaera galaxeae]|uniref:lysophospholipid acyltransferase family protein n=1 Tax=Aureisphaera galaxeae TaxID=1538023 RepID=UPI002350FF33|nr:lysophospholipid acyltransferase family protein [Aureisphaera galaxeae]MDC8002525.1 lysophospholipid acyltransferase family protein [Aureisphaera galaxeae]